MPLTFNVQKSPKDHPYLRTVSSGTVSAEDSNGLLAVVGPGQPHANMPILSIIEPGTDYTAEARKTFTAIGTNDGMKPLPVAVVVNNAALRVLISFVLRIAGAAGYTKFFSTEDEAKTWLFGHLDA